MKDKKKCIKKGKTVKIITGDDKGKTGTIIEVSPKKEKVRVSGIATKKIHKKGTKEKEGGVITREGFIHTSNISLIN